MNDKKSISAPVSVVVISVEDLNESLEFYAETIGLEIAETKIWQGPEFEQYWQVPAGTSAQCAFLKHGADPVGRIQLMEFNTPERKFIRHPGIRRATGLFNLNIYTSDIKQDYLQLKSQGFDFWSEPAYNNFGPSVGETMELAFDGPDGVVINLVELLTKDPKTLIGHIDSFVSKYGRTPSGFTAVVTTAHSVLDMEKALAFYYGPLNMTLFVDSILEGEETNTALNLEKGSRTHSVLVQGDHEYGKIALAAPLNYETPNLVPDAVAPNIGYLAQSFQISNIDEAASACAAIGVEEFSAPIEIDLPGRGKCKTMLVRNPGSGALQELFEAL
ncbi:MAG: VOC family protein [Gammaproteobacteria bacterium]|nr:VOC family protein [Gammaproteobacteria bacterium]MCP4090989.1 VOC family protein [Gammaproteobacteria bacterium]MCP4277485.1 VOC family protein [Gammaproteobacteria bacterium]MCP4831454.1 VOC family protein [Gammaproteobacteria bacterium]MCP4928518.1 VOC family protein [Gammaproteobacteria bacterium]